MGKTEEKKERVVKKVNVKRASEQESSARPIIAAY
jgi:hypothetical protein